MNHTPEFVKDNATLFAAADHRLHIKYGVSLNPFSTVGGHAQWQRGFDNEPLSALDDPVEYNDFFQRGRAAAELIETLEKQT